MDDKTLKVVSLGCTVLSVAVTITQAIVGDKQMDNKINEAVEAALAEKQ